MVPMALGKEREKKVRLTEIYFENIKPFGNFRLTRKKPLSYLMCGEYEGVGKTADVFCTLFRMVLNKGDRAFAEHSKQSDRPTAVILKEYSTNRSVYQGLFRWQGPSYYFRYDDGSMEYINLDSPDKVFKKDLVSDERWDRPEICETYTRMILSLILNLRPENCHSITPQNDFTIPFHTTFRDVQETAGAHKGKDDDCTKERPLIIRGKKDEPLEGLSDVLILTEEVTFKESWMQHELFATRYVSDDPFHEVVVVRLMSNGCSPQAMQAHLVILVEGEEDKFIVEKLINLYQHQVNDPVLRNMLNGTCIECFNGKGNLKNKIGRHLRSSILHVFVVDQDALYVNVAAEDIKDCYSDMIEPSESNYTPVCLSNKQAEPHRTELSKAPVVEILNRGMRSSDHYSKTEIGKRIREYMKTEKEASSALRKCIRDEKGLTYGDYIEFVQKESCIFTWKRADGTSSGALRLDKKAVIDKNQQEADNIEKMVKEEDEECNRFKDFLTKDVFKCYKRFNYDMSKQTAFRERQMLEETYDGECGVVKVSWLPRRELYTDDGIIKRAAENLGKELEGIQTEANAKGELLDERQTDDLDCGNRPVLLHLEKDGSNATEAADTQGEP